MSGERNDVPFGVICENPAVSVSIDVLIAHRAGTFVFIGTKKSKRSPGQRAT